jgi:transcriptional regulator with XRE-family HTH domain
MAKEVGVPSGLLAQIELGDLMPSRRYLETMAHTAGLTLEDTAELLDLAETLRRKNQKGARSAEGFAGLEETLRDHLTQARRRLLSLSTEPLHAWLGRRLREERERVAGQAETAAALARVAEKLAEGLQVF